MRGVAASDKADCSRGGREIGDSRPTVAEEKAAAERAAAHQRKAARKAAREPAQEKAAIPSGPS